MLGHERLEGLARGDVEVVRRLVEQEQVRRQQEEQRQLQPRAFTAGERRHFLEDVVAAEEEARQVAPRRSLGERHLVEERVEDRGAGDRHVAELGQVGRAGRCGPGPGRRRAAAARRRSCAAASSCRRRSGRRCRRDRRAAARATGRGRRASRCEQPGEASAAGAVRPRVRRRAPCASVPDDQPLRPDHRLVRASRAAAGQGLGRQPQPRIRAALLQRLEGLQAGLVLVHLRELALVAVLLDELPLAGDLRRLDPRLHPRPEGRAPRAGGRRRSSCHGTASTVDRAAPRRASRSRPGRRGRARPRSGCRGAGPGAPPATPARPGRGGSSARREAAGRGRPAAAGPAPRGSAPRRRGSSAGDPIALDRSRGRRGPPRRAGRAT